MRHCRTVVGVVTILAALVSLLSVRVRSRASLELKLVALRHQVTLLVPLQESLRRILRYSARKDSLRNSVPLSQAIYLR